MGRDRTDEKAHCYRVLVSATIYGRDEPTSWWPVIAADTEDEARVKALTLYGGPEGEWADHDTGPGLPARGEVAIIAVEHLHPISMHTLFHPPSEPPDVRRHP